MIRARLAATAAVIVSTIVWAHPAVAAPGPSGTSYEIVTTCSTGSMTVRVDRSAASAGSAEFSVTANGETSDHVVAAGERTSVTVRGRDAMVSGVEVREGTTTVASAVYADHCSSPASRVAGVSHFVNLPPTRVLDTRPQSLVGYSGPKPIARGTVQLVLAGAHGIAAEATAVVLNITATEADGAGYVQAIPDGHGQPGTSSNVNIERRGETIANAAIVKIGDGGVISLYTSVTTHLVVDVTGYFVPAKNNVASTGRYYGVTPTRMFDSRPSSAVQSNGAKLAAGSTIEIAIAPSLAHPDVPIPMNIPQPDRIGTAVLNLTATETAGAGYVQVAPGGELVPGASSNLNLEGPGQTIANLVIVPVSDGKTISIYTSATTHIVVDVLAYFIKDDSFSSQSGLFVPVDPERVLDTRAETRIDGGTFDGSPGTTTIVFDGLFGTMGSVVLSVVATEARAPGYVQVGPNRPPDGLELGAHSNLNVERAGQTIANVAFSEASQRAVDGVTLFTPGGAHLVADIFGWFTYSIVG